VAQFGLFVKQHNLTRGRLGFAIAFRMNLMLMCFAIRVDML